MIKQFFGGILILIVRIYQTVISPFFPATCRYHPTCSQYSIEAIRKHGPFKLRADEVLVDALDNLLKQFASQGRMKLHGEYKPCYEVMPL